MAPWVMSRKEFEKFIPVTELNRKNAIVQGRILYIISEVGKIITYNGNRIVDPCFTKGKWRIDHAPWHIKNTPSPTFDVYFFSSVEREHWASEWAAMIREGIQKKELFINPSDPIIQYFKI